METIQRLDYRLFREDDLAGILRLWKDHSGWGGITEKQFRDWYLDAPYGKCLVMVADHGEGELAGQMAFIPSQVTIQGKPYQALRAIAPILSEEFRQNSLIHSEHPTLSMFRSAIPEAQKNGFRLIYTLPAFGWLGLMRAFPRFQMKTWSLGSWPCFRIPLDRPDAPREEEGLQLRPGSGFSPEYDELWQDATRHFPIRCSVVRNRQWLGWKLDKMTVLEVRYRESGKLLGYAAVKGDGLIVDALAATAEALERVMRQLVWGLHPGNPHRLSLPFSGLKGMYTPAMAAALSSLNPEFPDFRFAFGIYPLDDALPMEALDISNWYLMPND